MTRLQKVISALVFMLTSFAIQAQNDSYQSTNSKNPDLVAKGGKPISKEKAVHKYIQEDYVSESFLDTKNGFIGFIFNKNVAKPNIYYKIVDQHGREIYNGSAHANQGSNPTLYYNTQNLPRGYYRIFIENDNFFLSTSFTK